VKKNWHWVIKSTLFDEYAKDGGYTADIKQADRFDTREMARLNIKRSSGGTKPYLEKPVKVIKDQYQ